MHWLGGASKLVSTEPKKLVKAKEDLSNQQYFFTCFLNFPVSFYFAMG